MSEVVGVPFVDEVSALLEQARQQEPLELLPEEEARMRTSARVLSERQAAGERIYGVTQGFGPLVTFEASPSGHEQGMNLLAHLGTSQGPALSPEVSQLLFWLRPHGGLRGRTVPEALEAGEQARVLELARAWVDERTGSDGAAPA